MTEIITVWVISPALVAVWGAMWVFGLHYEPERPPSQDWGGETRPMLPIVICPHPLTEAIGQAIVCSLCLNAVVDVSD